MFARVEEQHLRTPEVPGLFRDLQRSSVVATRFRAAGSTRTGPDDRLADEHVNRPRRPRRPRSFAGALEVRAGRKGQHEENEFAGALDAETGVGPYHGRPDIEAPGSARHEVALVVDQRGHRLEKQRFVDLRDREPGARTSEALRVHVGPEQHHVPVVLAKRLQPFEHRLTVVEHRGSRMQGKRRERLDAWIDPLAIAVFRDEKVRRENLPEVQLLWIERLRRRTRPCQISNLTHRYTPALCTHSVLRRTNAQIR